VSIHAAEAGEAAAKVVPAAAQSQQLAGASVTKISVTSSPLGADIEVDGGFVGNTPSTIEVPAGEHTVAVSKAGYKNWERKLKASGGNVNLSVDLEAQAK
jgi:PEGA domain